jgi:N-acetylneuraminic acid mutarotase
MIRSFRAATMAVAAVIALLVGTIAAFTANAAYSRATGTEATSPNRLVPEVRQATRADVSPPLSSIAPIRPQNGTAGEFPLGRLNKNGEQAQGFVDSITQRVLGPLAMPSPIANFDGMFNYWGGYPPDTSGDVGPNHFVQIVNVGFQVFSKTGTSLYGPANNNTLFTGFGGVCETTNRGDPIALYDSMADRFVVSWFAFTNGNGPTWQCVAVTASPDPTGAWYRYQFAVGNTFEDYPHMGVWPDAYYMTTNTFGGPTAGGNYAFERDRMLQGDPTARVVIFRTADSGILPSDLDGPPPPAGSPNYFMEWYNTTSLREFKFHVDWTNPANSTFTGPFTIPVTAFNSGVPGITQPGTSATLDTLSDRLMYRLAYRNMGSYESLVVNHTVNASGVAGIRWYEIRNPNGTPPTLFQEGTYAPGDGVHRWMGSIAMDHQGNIAVGFSASNSSVYPSIRYAGRLVTDPAGQLSQGEATLIAGTGSQTGPVGRWGDYAQINVDPTDDCTFWFTTEYIQVTGERSWRTRIGSFKFPGCTAQPLPPAPTATGTPPTATPVVPTATACANSVVATGSITNTDLVQTSRLISVGLPPSTCATPRNCPGQDTGDTTQHHYDTYNYTNSTGSSQCVTVSINPGCTNNALTSIAYLGSYDPANKCANYIADGARGGVNNVYSFNLAAGQTAVVIVFEHNGGLGCETYTIRINPCDAASGGTATPTIQATSTGTPPAVTATPTQCGTAASWVLGPEYNPAVYAVQGATAADGNFYVAGGQDGDNIPQAATARFNPGSNTFTSLAPMPVGVGQAAVGSAGNKLYVAGGYLGGSAITNTLQIYDIPSNTWSFGPPMPSEKEAAGGVVVNNKFYVIGGDDFNAVVDTNYIYDIATNTWSTGAPLPAGRSNVNATTVGGLIYVYGGVIGGSFEADDSLLSYNPATNTWTPLANAGVAGFGNYGTISPYGAGRLLALAGGDTTFEPSNRTRVYDIASNTWTEGPTLNVARMGNAQGTLPDGRIIVVSGYDGTGTMTSTELLNLGTPCASPTVQATVTTQPSSTSTATAGTAVPTSTACTITFSDVPPNHTFYPFVRCLACRGIINGYPDGTFKPDNHVTRGQLAKIVSNSAGFTEPVTTQTFEDVVPGSTFYEYIERLATRQVMGGYVCGVDPSEPCVPPDNRPYFRPNAGATRGQLTKIVSNAAGFNDTIPDTQYTFTDVEPGSTFWLYVERLLLNRPGVMSGYACGGPGEPCDSENRPYFRPNNPLTRGQTAKIVANTFFPGCQTPARR